jgi:hypothetical protein
MVMINFSDQPGELSIPCSEAGVYREMVVADVRQAPYEIAVRQAGDRISVQVPSNYASCCSSSTAPTSLSREDRFGKMSTGIRKSTLRWL